MPVVRASFSRNLPQLSPANSSTTPNRRMIMPLPTDGNPHPRSYPFHVSMNRDEDVFAGALAVPRTERTSFLNRACGGDAVLRARVEALLNVHDGSPSFLEIPLAGRTAVGAQEKRGDKVGRHTLLQKIGEPSSRDGSRLGSRSTFLPGADVILHVWRAPTWEEIEAAEKLAASSHGP